MGFITGNFLERKIHSLTGIIPIGVFLLEHLITNSFALKGPEYYNQKIEAFQQIPFLVPIEILLIAVPLAFHTILGLYYVYLSKNNVLQYKYFRNYMFYLQRITAIVTFLFVIYHAYTARIARAISGIEISYEFMNGILAQPLFFIIYLVGLLAAVFHFSNGIYTFAISWGITLGPRSQKILQNVCTALFLIMSGAGTVGLIALAG
ncbi:succinate dehydrogenase [Phosphitispora fastidiosa]|uniref:succinate dehydrogenase n=1 Tax=Phosphitispora fastidiosa TaxID=2837202 RepID=UPI001E5297FB|nr:succinate dehydrogenase [Phosphitispora fastidiosa]MBU7007615.1 succinate dehydrogenase / fumarate reductase cytochrome b subunit [Phosphitispora fastidiosa]